MSNLSICYVMAMASMCGKDTSVISGSVKVSAM
jgi:hypothetical protein